MRFFAVLLMFCALSAQAATHVMFDLAAHFNASPATNRQFTLQPLTPFVGNVVTYTSDASGQYTVSNMAIGPYAGIIKPKGLADAIQFQITINSTNLGVVTASSVTTVGNVPTYPVAGRTAYSVQAMDEKLSQIGTNGGVGTANNLIEGALEQVTNAALSVAGARVATNETRRVEITNANNSFAGLFRMGNWQLKDFNGFLAITNDNGLQATISDGGALEGLDLNASQLSSGTVPTGRLPPAALHSTNTLTGTNEWQATNTIFRNAIADNTASLTTVSNQLIAATNVVKAQLVATNAELLAGIATVQSSVDSKMPKTGGTFTGGVTNQGLLAWTNTTTGFQWGAMNNEGSGQGLLWSYQGGNVGTFSSTKITWAGIAVTAPTGNRAAILDVQGNLTNSVTTATELSYVSGVTSAIQTQLDKLFSSNAVHRAAIETVDSHVNVLSNQFVFATNFVVTNFTAADLATSNGLLGKIVAATNDLAATIPTTNNLVTTNLLTTTSNALQSQITAGASGIVSNGGSGINNTFTNTTLVELQNISVPYFVLSSNSTYNQSGENPGGSGIILGRDNNVGFSTEASAIFGGQGNTIGNAGDFNTILGGRSNLITTGANAYNTIMGGHNNTISFSSGDGTAPQYATALGGYGNTAQGEASVAMGYQAQTAHKRSFAFSDGLQTGITTGSNQFRVYAKGGLLANNWLSVSYSTKTNLFAVTNVFESYGAGEPVLNGHWRLVSATLFTNELTGAYAEQGTNWLFNGHGQVLWAGMSITGALTQVNGTGAAPTIVWGTALQGNGLDVRGSFMPTNIYNAITNFYSQATNLISGSGVSLTQVSNVANPLDTVVSNGVLVKLVNATNELKANLVATNSALVSSYSAADLVVSNGLSTKIVNATNALASTVTAQIASSNRVFFQAIDNPNGTVTAIAPAMFYNAVGAFWVKTNTGQNAIGWDCIITNRP